MSEHTLQLVDALRRRLHKAAQRVTLAELLYGLVLTLGILTGLWLLSVAVEAGLWMAPTPRTIWFWALAALAAALVTVYLLRPLLRLMGVLRGPSEEQLAARIGTRYPDVSDRLLNLLQLSAGRHSDAPSPLLDGAVRMLGEQVRPVPFEQVEDFGRARRAVRYAGLPVLGLLIFLTAAPTTFLDASKRLLTPGAAFVRPAPFQLSVTPGDVELVKGEQLAVTVHAEGEQRPDAVTLVFQHEGEQHVDEVPLAADSAGAFRHERANVRQTLRYRAVAGGVASPWYEARVTERPILRGLRLALDFPAYTGIPPQRLAANVGDVTALPGTRVTVTAGLGGADVHHAALHFDDGRQDTLVVGEQAAEGTFTLRREGSYQVVLQNARGLTNADPIRYQLRLLTDAAPAIVLLEPEPTTTLDERLQTRLRARLTDDFGFARLRLYYRLAESRFGTPDSTFRALDLPLERPGLLDQEVVHAWRLTDGTGLDPVPGDVVEYYLQVWDNDAVAGYKSARSAVQQLRLPSLTEQYEELDQAQDETEGTLEDLVRESESVREQFEELRDELRRKPDADWEDRRQLEQLQERQQALESRAEELVDQVESLTRQMEDNDLVSEETMELYDELQKVAEEVRTPELTEALRELQRAMEQMDLQQMQQSIENFEFSEEQYQQRLERTLDLFKKLRLQQQLDEAARRTEELAKQQEQLSEATERLRDDADEAQDDPAEAEPQDGDRPEGEQQEGDPQEDEQPQGEPQQDDQQQGDQQQGDQQQGDQQQGDQQQQEAGDRSEAPATDEERQQEAERLAREQDRSAEEMEQLQEQLRELREQMEEVRSSPKQQMDRLNEQLEQQQMPQQMRQNAEQLRQQQMRSAQQQQQQMQQSLQQMQQQLQSMQQGMQQQQMSIDKAGLRQALSDVLTLSHQQETLRSDVRGLAADSPRLRDAAQAQVELSEGLGVVSDSLQRLARDVPQMSRAVQVETGQALREMGSATTAMTDRDAAQASGYQKAAMMHLNELALLLSDLLDQMNQQSGSGSGNMSMQQMMQQMQDMAQQQGQLNQQIQQMLNDLQGNRLSQDMQQRLDQMARQQQAIQQQLKQLSRNPEARGNLLGDLNKIAEQMEETIQELQRRRPDRRTIERQQQILTRLLDATKSMQQRGREQRREGQRGEDVQRQSPAELTPSEQADRLRRDLLRALDSGYAPDYEELIKRYFELLQRQSQDQRPGQD